MALKSCHVHQYHRPQDDMALTGQSIDKVRRHVRQSTQPEEGTLCTISYHIPSLPWNSRFPSFHTSNCLMSDAFFAFSAVASRTFVSFRSHHQPMQFLHPSAQAPGISTHNLPSNITRSIDPARFASIRALFFPQ
jgi:hypothetical protein